MSPHDFDRFVGDNGDGLLRTAYLMVGDLHEAEDLVQETLFRVASRWPRVSRMDKPVAYSRRILVNLASHGSSKRSRNMGRSPKWSTIRPTRKQSPLPVWPERPFRGAPVSLSSTSG